MATIIYASEGVGVSKLVRVSGGSGIASSGGVQVQAKQGTKARPAA